jgi:hypothetical protein
MPLQNEHAARINAASKYDEFRRVNDKFAPGIDVVFGILPDGTTEIHAIHFKTDKFTESQARAWLKSNDFTPIVFAPAAPDETAAAKHAKQLQTVDLDGEEIFSIGTWTATNGKARKYSIDELTAMAAAANETSYQDKPLKLGHNNEQKALKEAGLFADGAPAAGWMKNFRVQGEKLIADFKQVPKVIADLIQAGAYKQKSLELWDNFKDEAQGKTYKTMPVAVALLGTELPAVSNLNSILSTYSICESSPATQFLFQIAEKQSTNDGGDSIMSPEEIKAMQEENAASKAECAKLTAQIAKMEKANHARAEEDAAKDSKIADLETAKAAVDAALHAKADTSDATTKSLQEQVESLKSELAQFAKSAADAKAAEREAFLLANADKLAPSQRIAYKRSLEVAAESPALFSYSKGEGETAETLTGEDAVRAEIEALPTNPLLIEHGKSEERKGVEDTESKIAKYAKDNSLNLDNTDDYRKAVKGAGVIG